MKLTIKNILVWCAGLLAVVAFFLMFANAAKQIIGNSVHYFKGTDVLFGNKDTLALFPKGAVGSFIGYLLVLVGGLCAVVVSFVLKDAKLAKIVTLAAAALILVGAVLVFCEKAMWLSANDYSGNDNLKVCGGPVVAGIMSVVSAGALAVSQLVKLDK